MLNKYIYLFIYEFIYSPGRRHCFLDVCVCASCVAKAPENHFALSACNIENRINHSLSRALPANINALELLLSASAGNLISLSVELLGCSDFINENLC